MKVPETRKGREGIVGYDYKTERAKLFTDDGQRTFLKIRDHVRRLLEKAGAFRLDAGIREASGDSWTMIACIDRLVELGEIHECQHENYKAAQNRIFTDGGWRP